MDFQLPAEITATLAQRDGFVKAGIKPPGHETTQFFDHRRHRITGGAEGVRTRRVLQNLFGFAGKRASV